MAPAYFAFYPKDFTGDMRVQCMTPEERGGYIMLLCMAWQAEGVLPNDDSVLAQLSGLGERWGQCKPNILPCFTCNGTTLTQKRLAEEYRKAERMVSQRSLAGKRSAEAKAVMTPRSTTVERAFQRNVNGESGYGYESFTSQELEVFNKIWDLYPKKMRRLRALNIFSYLSPDSTTVERMLKSIERRSKSHDWQKENGRWIPLLENWLADRRWEDDETVSDVRKEKIVAQRAANAHEKANAVPFDAKAAIAALEKRRA